MSAEANLPTPTPDVGPGGPALFVGVGASAGGLEALERLFHAMPPKTGAAFIVVQHLSPDFKSLTDELLARHTTIPIFRVETGMIVLPDTIYLIPPRKDMELAGGRLLLTDKDPAQFVALPIDHFFRSLAREAGERAVGVVLSGTGSDGSRGIRDIHAAGGLVIAQDPATAKFDGMPRSAIETTLVHHVLAPQDVPQMVVRHIARPETSPVTAAPLEGPAPAALKVILRLLRDSFGVDFSLYKPDTVARRVERRLLLGQIEGMEDYAARLANDPDELNQLHKDMLIGVTRFFRDDEAFQRLEREVLPGLLAEKAPGDEIRFWVAGCATGEEAYSLAMLLREALDRLAPDTPVKIFATDIHRAALDTASAGLYPEAALTHLSAERQERYFSRKGEGFQVVPDLRKMVVFAQHNLTRDAPFTKLDLISCRNLLIYLLPAPQRKILALFHFALRAGGALFLGPSESPGEISDEFEVADSHWKIYRKQRESRRPPDLRLTAQGATSRPVVVAAPAAGKSVVEHQLLGVYDALLGEHMPPSLLVNQDRGLVQSFAGAHRFLRVRDGRFSHDILDMLDPELRMALTGALGRAFKEHTPISYKGLRVTAPSGEVLVDVTVKPVHSATWRAPGSPATHALILIQERGPAAGLVPAEELLAREIDLDQASREQVLSLEAELRYTKENLQAMIEELETANEELQASNEELLASNEELQSTNEELHSVNEELYTVNGEYQKKIAELTELTADMDNLLSSTQVHTIFLDRNLCIRKFTPKIAETFNLLPQDVGRSIDNFTYTIDHPGLLADLQTVLESCVALERQVRERRGGWFLLRVLPYRTGLAVEGVVLTLIDLSLVKQVEAEARRKDQQLAGILRNSPNWVILKDLQGRYIVTDESFKRAVRTDPIGKTSYDLFPRDVADRLSASDDRVIAEGVEIESEVVITRPDGPHTYLSVKFPLRDEEGRIVGVGGIKTDITQMKQALSMAREAVEQRDRFLAMLSHELRNPLAAVLNAVILVGRAGPGGSVGEWFPVIERRCKHMARLLDDLLDVSRLTQNKIEIRRARLDLRELVPQVIEEVRGLFEERGLMLIAGTLEDSLPVEGDPARLQQVQVNLLLNAAKYTPRGGRVWYDLSRAADRVLIRVRDTGVGLAPAMLEKVFDLFVQADETLDRSEGGIGVGLTLVRSLVELHGGRVQAASAGPGRGSEFTVWLPLTSPAPPPPSPLPPPKAPAPLRILLVEDDVDIRLSLESILMLDGHTVRSVGDGLTALNALAELIPDVAVVDIGIPGIDGYELARRVRARYQGGAIHLIALTGYGRASDQNEAFAAGFDVHLTKPFRPDELTRLLTAPRESHPQLTRPVDATDPT